MTIMYQLFLISDEIEVNTFDPLIEPVSLGCLIIPLLLLIVTRFFLLPKLSNAWIQLLVFLPCMFGLTFISLLGIFIGSSHKLLFDLSQLLLLILFIPYWIRAKKKSSQPPSLPAG